MSDKKYKILKKPKRRLNGVMRNAKMNCLDG